jgi:3-methyladenine DNA glycosylase/8-oxoguanine DNA glycosylase
VVYGLRKTPTHEQMEKLANGWRKHASLASLYLWKISLQAKPLTKNKRKTP